MARKRLVNMTQALATEGINQTTVVTLTASGQSRAFPEFASSDATVLYIDSAAPGGTGTPTLQFTLSELDPATGVFFAVAGAPGTGLPIEIPPITGAVDPSADGYRVVIDPDYAECYQLSWTITGTSPSFACSVLAQLCTWNR